MHTYLFIDIHIYVYIGLSHQQASSRPRPPSASVQTGKNVVGSSAIWSSVSSVVPLV